MCPNCGIEYERTQKQVNVVVKRSGVWKCQMCANRIKNERSAKPLGSTRLSRKGYIIEKTVYGWIFQHDYVMGKHVGRNINTPFEIVHHKNGIKTDNGLENLELKLRGEHTREHNLERVYERGYRVIGQGLINIRAARRKHSLFSIEEVRNIRFRLDAGDTQRGLARELNVSPRTINLIANRGSYKDVV
jgi:hypothetical protein